MELMPQNPLVQGPVPKVYIPQVLQRKGILFGWDVVDPVKRSCTAREHKPPGLAGGHICTQSTAVRRGCEYVTFSPLCNSHWRCAHMRITRLRFDSIPPRNAPASCNRYNFRGNPSGGTGTGGGGEVKWGVHTWLR